MRGSFGIVVLDDELMSAELLAAMLDGDGHRVHGVTDDPGRAADLVNEFDADLLLADLFPIRSGIEVTAELARQRLRARLVALCRTNSPEDRANALACGAGACFSKTRPYSELAALLERVMGRPPTAVISLARPSVAAGSPQLSDLLTKRELEVLCGLVDGQTTEALAVSLGVTSTTIRGYVQRVLAKLGVHSRSAAVALAVRSGVVSTFERISLVGS